MKCEIKFFLTLRIHRMNIGLKLFGTNEICSVNA